MTFTVRFYKVQYYGALFITVTGEREPATSWIFSITLVLTSGDISAEQPGQRKFDEVSRTPEKSNEVSRESCV